MREKADPRQPSWESPLCRGFHRGAWRAMRPVLQPVWRAVMTMTAHDGFELAGYVSYTTIFALFPFAIFLTALAGFLGNAATAEQLIDNLLALMPTDVVSTLAPTIRDVLTKQQGGLLTFGIVFTLYSASSGVEALRMSLNRAYGTPVDPRAVWTRRAQSLAFVIFGATALLVVALLIIAAPLVLAFVQRWVIVPVDIKLLIEIGRYAVGAFLIVGVLILLHLWLPCRTPAFRHVLPGVLLTAFLGILGASLLSLYLSLAGTFTVTYGGLGGVMVTLFFFYLNAALFIFGAELNAALFDLAPTETHQDGR